MYSSVFVFSQIKSPKMYNWCFHWPAGSCYIYFKGQCVKICHLLPMFCVATLIRLPFLSRTCQPTAVACAPKPGYRVHLFPHFIQGREQLEMRDHTG